MRVAGRAIVAGMAVTLLASCGRSVAVDPLPISSQQTRQACSALISDLPTSISAGRSWEVEPDPDSTKSWGSPPVVLRCGDEVPQPAPTDQLLSINGLDWLVTPLTEGEQYTTVARIPGVMVTVPAAYQPSADVVAEVSGIVAGGTAAAEG